MGDAVDLSETDLDAPGLEALVSPVRVAGWRDLEAFARYGNGVVPRVEVDAPVDVAELRPRVRRPRRPDRHRR